MSPINEPFAVLNIKDPFNDIRNSAGIAHFAPRDLRRTAASHMTGQLKFQRFLVGQVLNHVEKGITKVYDRYSYDAEKRTILAEWNDPLDQLIAGERSKVIDFRVNRRLA